MPVSETALHAALRWWASRGDANDAPDFTGDFLYEDSLTVSPREDFVSTRKLYGAHHDLRILQTVCAPDRASVLFEAIDEVTGLHHRFAWFFTLRGAQISRINACVSRGLVPPHTLNEG